MTLDRTTPLARLRLLDGLRQRLKQSNTSPEVNQLADSPAAHDLLDFEKYTLPITKKISEAIRNRETPLTIGVYGEWGSGKTSFLCLIEQALKAEQIHPIWFNAWKYSQEDNLWAALLQRVLDEAPINGSRWQRAGIKLRLWRDSIDLRAGSWEVIRKIAPIVLRLSLVLLAVLLVRGGDPAGVVERVNRILPAWASLGPGALSLLSSPYARATMAIVAFLLAKPDDILKLFNANLGIDFAKLQKQQSYRQRIAFLDEFSAQFERIIHCISAKKPLVLMIDDLDRCLPEKALQVLEAVKLFLDVKPCVFLIAVDREVVEKAIAVRYRELFKLAEDDQSWRNKAAFLGENYFDKIIQLPIPVPPLTEEQMRVYAARLHSDEEIRRCSGVLAVGLPANPRKIKRALQILLLLREIAREPLNSSALMLSLLAKLVVIQQHYRPVYADLLDTPALLEELERAALAGAQVVTPTTDRPEHADAAALAREALAQRAHSFLQLYPQLRKVFTYRSEESDTFVGAPVEKYIYLLREITEPRRDDRAEGTTQTPAEHAAISNAALFEQVAQTPYAAEVLEAAQARLAALPRTALARLGPLAPFSRMPYSRNPLFVGREAELRWLATTISATTSDAEAPTQTLVVTGMGGVGKTQLVIEFVHRYGHYFAGGVFWLNFADPNAVPVEVAVCGGPGLLDLHPDFSNLPLDEQLRLVVTAWQSALPRLLIFDNCEDPELMARWRPTSGGSRVIVTSRRAQWDSALGVRMLALDPLPREESVALLLRHRPDLRPDDTLAEIATEVGDLPLALELAGQFLSRYRDVMTPQEYLKQLRKALVLDHRSLQQGGPLPTGHETSVARTIGLSYKQLNPDDAVDRLAQLLISRASYFAPGASIPRDLLLLTVPNPPEASTRHAPPLQGHDALQRLQNLGLITLEDPGMVLVHPLVASYFRGDETAPAAQDDVEVTVESAALQLADNPTAHQVREILPHLLFIANHALGRADLRAASLSNAAGDSLARLGDYAQAQIYYEQALDIRSARLGDSHLDTAQTLNNLGYLLYRRGHYEAAESYLQSAHDIYAALLGAQHPVLVRILNNLGGVFEASNEYEHAQAYYQRAVDLSRRQLGSDSPDVAVSLNNLGVLLQRMGKCEEALSTLQSALELKVRTLGERHPETAATLSNLGLLALQLGQRRQAEDYLCRALAIREAVLGDQHPSTAQSFVNLGGLRLEQQRYAEAQSLFDRALQIQEPVLGPEHPETIRIYQNLMAVHRLQGQADQAQHYYELALSISRRVLGNDHPLTRLIHSQGADFVGPE